MISTYHQQVEGRLTSLGFNLPESRAPAANYSPFKLAGHVLYISGQLPADSNGDLIKGICGASINVEDGMKAAELCALQLLAQAKAAVGDFDRIDGLTKIVGFVASTPDFEQQPQVINGASNLLVEALGERGKHARSAVGVAALPLGIAVEIEAIFELKQ